MIRHLCVPVFLIAMTTAAQAQFNYDEAKVPKYNMINPLVMTDGSPVKTAADWPKRRAEILKLFETHVYGKTPVTKPARFEVVEKNTPALDGKAIRRQVRVHFTDKKDGPGVDLLIYLPAKASGATPIFLGLNFNGNHTIHRDPAIRLSEGYVRNNKKLGITNNRANEKTRGTSDNWSIDLILSRGYGLATMHHDDIEPDLKDGFSQGVRALYPKPGPDGWAAIAGWAWVLSQAVDYFETDTKIDAKRVIVMGHSRLGKTSLWAGATDPRFAMVISNNSGCGGAALSKRAFGETVARINKNFPHWFCENFKKYNDKEQDLPLDQHMLMSLIAPRPLYVASATEDRWADPHGEFLAAHGASPVYKLLGTEGLPATKMPNADQPSHGRIGYHLRTGKHDVTEYDWKQYIDFADKNVK